MLTLNFTKMKKLFTLLSLFVLIGMSANVFAQTDSGTTPFVGSVHNYQINEVSGSSVTYTWTVTTQADLGGTNLLTAGTVVSGSPATNSIELTWLAPDVTNDQIYYLHVDVQDDNECKNHKVMAIQPVNNFNLEIVNAESDGTEMTAPDATNYAICAPDIAFVAWNGTDGGAGSVTAGNATDFDYAYGSRVFYYKITADGINLATTSWTPHFDVTRVAGTNADVAVDYYIGADLSSPTWVAETLAVGSDQSVAVGTDEGTLWVRITVDNKTGTPSTANENTPNDNVFTCTLTNSSVDENGNNPVDLGNVSTIQTQTARPNTGTIQAID